MISKQALFRMAHSKKGLILDGRAKQDEEGDHPVLGEMGKRTKSLT